MNGREVTLAEMVLETARYARLGAVESMRALVALREVLAPEAEKVLARPSSAPPRSA